MTAFMLLQRKIGQQAQRRELEKKHKVYAGRRGSWMVLDRPTAFKLLKGANRSSLEAMWGGGGQKGLRKDLLV